MPDSARLSPYVGYVVALLCAVNLCNSMDRVAIAVLSPLIKAEFRLSDSELGLLNGLAFSLFYALCGIPIARWADHGVRRDIVALAVATWSVMTALCGAAQSFAQLVLARVGVAGGEAGSTSPGGSILCDYVPFSRRANALAVAAFGNALGLLAGMALAGVLSERMGWRGTFVALGLPGLALALLVRLTLREPPRGDLDATRDAKVDARHMPALGETIALLWRCRTYCLLTLFLVANGFVQIGLSQWWPTYYTRVSALPLSSVGVFLGMASGVASGLGVLGGGAMTLKVAGGSVGLPLKLSAFALLVSIGTAFGSLFVSSVGGSIALVSLTGFLWGISNGPVLAALYSVVNSRMRATAGSLAGFLTSVLGLGLGPFCVGLLSDALTPALGLESLRFALLLPVFMTAVTVIALLAASKTLPLDLQAVGEGRAVATEQAETFESMKRRSSHATD